MNAILSEAIESYRFNNDLLDAIINDIPMSPAMEEAGQTGTPSNTTTTNTSTTASNTTDNKNEANPTASGEAKEKKDFNLIEKIKKIFQFLQDMVMKVITNIKGKLQYISQSKLAYDREIKELQKKYKPRFDLVKKNRRYDFDILNKTVQALDRVYNEYTNDLTACIGLYRKSLNGQMTVEEYNTKMDEYKKKPVHDNTAKEVAKVLGSEFGKVETFSHLIKAIQQKHRGMQISASADNNENAPKGEGSVEMVLDQQLYNNCSKFIMNFNTRIQNCHHFIDRLKMYQDKMKSDIESITNNSQQTAEKGSATSILNMTKSLNFFSTMVNFLVSSYTEQLVNCRMVVKACLGGASDVEDKKLLRKFKEHAVDRNLTNDEDKLENNFRSGIKRRVQNAGRAVTGRDRLDVNAAAAPKLGRINAKF